MPTFFSARFLLPLSPTPDPEPPFDAEETIARYKRAALALLPPGKGISKSLESNIGKVLEACCVEFARIHERALLLRKNMIPSKADELLVEWEEAVGIEADGTTEERQNALVVKLLGRTLHSLPAFEAAADELGFAIESVSRNERFRAGSGTAGSPVWGIPWAFQVTITVSGGTVDTRPALTAAFDRLKRSHGRIDVTFT